MEVSRDGVILAHAGGGAVPLLKPKTDAPEQTLDSIWPHAVASAVKQLARKAIVERTTLEMRFELAGHAHQARASALGPERALCIVRPELPSPLHDAAAPANRFQGPQLDRRGFLGKFRAIVAQSLLAETPVAIIVLLLDGVAAISRTIDSTVSDEVVTAALLKIPPSDCSIGQLNRSTLAFLMETADRARIDATITAICKSLAAPVVVGNAVFQISPYAGAAILGRDATSAEDLLSHARVAALEARRSGSPDVQFFSDSVKLKSLARLDTAVELREAIASGGIQARFVGRHSFSHGRLVALVCYLQWTHPLRGDIAPKEILGVAEATGCALELSRALLRSFAADFGVLSARVPPDIRFSFGPLRHHVLHDEFIADIDRLLAMGTIPANRLEIRISERVLVALHASICDKLKQRGIRIVVDELGRGMGSLNRLARAPLWGLQLDRAWVKEICEDKLALRVCRAAIAATAALGLVPMATGVDNDEQREALLGMGCEYGSGDLFSARPRADDKDRAICA